LAERFVFKENGVRGAVPWIGVEVSDGALKYARGAQYLTGEYIKAVWAEFSTLS